MTNVIPGRKRRGRRGGGNRNGFAGSHPGHRPEQGQGLPQGALMTTLAQRCQRHFPGRARALGHDYFLTGRVSEPSRDGETFTLTVLGSGPSYSVVLDFSKVPTTKSMDARCDCPYYDGGGLCKHLWASVLQIDKAGMAAAIPEAGPLRVLHLRPRNRRDPRQEALVRLPTVLPTPMVLPTPNAPIISNWLADEFASR